MSTLTEKANYLVRYASTSHYMLYLYRVLYYTIDRYIRLSTNYVSMFAFNQSQLNKSLLLSG